MGAQTAITHATQQQAMRARGKAAQRAYREARGMSGVSLAKSGEAVSPVAPASPARMVDVGEGGWWGVPAYVVRGWITVRLRKGEYAQASWLSARLHGGVL